MDDLVGTTLGERAGEQETAASSARRRSWLLGGGVALGVVAGVTVLVIVMGGAASRPVTVAPSGRAAATAPAREIVIYVADLPADATLLLDGVPAANPIRLPRHPGEEHVIRARAPGFIDHDTSFTADNDMTIAIGLLPLGPSPAPPPTPAPARKKADGADRRRLLR